MGRELSEAPEGPPPRPAGVPDRPPTQWLEYRSAQGGGLPSVWLWWDGRWVDAVPVRGAGRDAKDRWWYFVQVDGRLDWVHESRTAPWGPGPDAQARQAPQT
ncbi:MAG TPA: hypothetical protein VLL08_12695 [Kineosporiaceae bacterium]|nr:hypothetical protein [Kineosporiaceae bacterium]